MSDPLAQAASGKQAEQPIPELLRLGEQVAAARQAAGVSIEELAQRLRLAPGQLQALEEGDHSRLPEGVFVVALARRVAGALHADLDEAIQAVKQSHLMRRPLLAVPRPAAPPHPPAAPIQPETDPVGADPAGASASPQRAMPWRWPLAALIAASGLAAAWLLVPHPSPREGISSAPSRPKPQAAPPSAPAQPLSPAASPAAADTLRLSASEPSWVEVREVKGRTLFEGTFSGEKRFPVGRGIEVIAGRPHAVRAAMGSAAGVPLGGVADIRWKRFSPAGLQPEPPASPSPSP